MLLKYLIVNINIIFYLTQLNARSLTLDVSSLIRTKINKNDYVKPLISLLLFIINEYLRDYFDYFKLVYDMEWIV